MSTDEKPRSVPFEKHCSFRKNFISSPCALLLLAVAGMALALTAEMITEKCAFRPICWMDDDQQTSIERSGSAVASGAILAAVVRQNECNNEARRRKERAEDQTREQNRLQGQRNVEVLEKLLREVEQGGRFNETSLSGVGVPALNESERAALSKRSVDLLKKLEPTVSAAKLLEQNDIGGFIEIENDASRALTSINSDLSRAERQRITGVAADHDGQKSADSAAPDSEET